jgi:hypothetical protein
MEQKVEREGQSNLCREKEEKAWPSSLKQYSNQGERDKV